MLLLCDISVLQAKLTLLTFLQMLVHATTQTCVKYEENS